MPRHRGKAMPPNDCPTLGNNTVALSDRIPYQAAVDRPRLRLPGDKKLAGCVILNVEEWRIGGAMPRALLSPPMGQPPLAEVPKWWWHEYGLRAGLWRPVKTLAR